MLSDPDTTEDMFPGYDCEAVNMQSSAAASYLGEEGALVVGELDLGDIEELELPLGGDQQSHGA